MAFGQKSRVSSSESANDTDSGYAPSSGSAFKQRESSSSPFFSSLRHTFKHPRILESLLSFVSYEDFNVLTSSCSDLRHLMKDPALKDIILSRFLPGFRSLLRFKNHELFVDVHVTISDLNIFQLSDKTGPHVYPVHALQFNTRPDDAHQLKLLEKLQCLTIVHSKFVLLLQSLAHSSIKPLKPELEDLPPRSNPLTTLPPGLKELHFPEPLCYNGSPALLQRTPSSGKHKRTQSAEIVMGQSKASGKKRSFLIRSKEPLPPPSLDFILRQSYFSPWRRVLESSSAPRTPEPSSSPRRRRFINASSWSDSSISTSTRLSIIQEKRASVSIPRLRIPFQSPHDISLATSRVHAPVLRVFVPCTELNDLSIIACEEQLSDAGLSDHLSIGDIVCNLGYTPLPPSPDEYSQEDFAMGGPGSITSEPSSLGNGINLDDTLWLVYDGFGLMQYSPTAEPPPLKDALTLVTPHYYSHVLPSSAHPIFTLDLHTRLSGFREPAEGTIPSPPKLDLVRMLMKVRSPNSPGGYAMVRRYKWVGTIKGFKAALSGGSEVGNHWLTDEWALEVDGTSEGRKMLESLLYPPDTHVASKWAVGDWVWEIDRQRSNLSTTWFRLLGSSDDYVLPLDPTVPSPGSPIFVAPFYRGSPGSAVRNQRRFSFMVR